MRAVSRDLRDQRPRDGWARSQPRRTAAFFGRSDAAEYTHAADGVDRKATRDQTRQPDAHAAALAHGSERPGRISRGAEVTIGVFGRSPSPVATGSRRHD